MMLHYLALLISLLFVITNADGNKIEQSAINVAVDEHEPNDIPANDSSDQSWKTTTEKILIRVTRLHANPDNSKRSNRQRRQYVEKDSLSNSSYYCSEHDEYEKITDEIWGMAKKVAITVFVLVSLCIVCCLVTTIFICVKCCCGDNNSRKRNQGFVAVPQPIVIHTGSPNYQPQAHQMQQSPPPQTWSIGNHPMLPQPSAPPQSNDDFHMEQPPPYEQICNKR